MSNSAAVIGAPTVQVVTEDTNQQILTAAGSISISDANAGQAAFKTTVIAASGDLGSLTIAANGSYVYSVADSKVQYLGAGGTKVDAFTVTSLDGTTKQVSFTIIGVNDAAVIGTPTVTDVTEDATSPTLKATGSISISDVDQNQAAFKTTVTSAASDLGTLVLQSNGSYTYSVADSAVQYLGAGQTKVDTFTVTSLDGSTRQVSFTIHGTNDAAVIGTPTVHDVTEDATNPTLMAVGSISITDADQGQATFKTTVASAAGNLGSLVLAANGTYTYSVADSKVQYLGAGNTKVDIFTVTALDGTQKQVSFTIHGVNDAAVIGTPTVHDVTEDATNPLLLAIGTVSITDADQGQAAFQPALLAGNGNLGALIIGGNGAYIYAVTDGAVQYLGAGDTKVDTFTLTSLDGTTKQVTFTIHGTNDAAVIGTPTVHDVTEDANVTAGNLTASGTLSISDADQNQSSFQTIITAPASTLGHLTIGANGAYSYTVADSAVQYLGATDTKAEIFTVTSLDGTTKQVTFTIHGTNDAAVIGDLTVHDVTKNASPTTLTAVGTISISDLDQNQSTFQTTVIPAGGNLGHLVIAATGVYTYSVANSATQSLGAADTKVDTFTVTALDGTTKAVSFTIHGGSAANTPAVIGNPDHATVTEDVNVSAATLTVSGTIPVTDPDAGQVGFQTTVMPGSDNLGSLVLQSNGSYTYSVLDNVVQYLGLGDSTVDTFSIKSIDGTTKVVSFTIQGANDAAVISDPVVHSVTEDAGGVTLTATGQLTATDIDQNQSSFQPGATGTPSNLGTLTLAANGTYTYSVANAATQSLAGGQTHTDTFTVHSFDGTPKTISFDIHGADDLPRAVADTGTMTEDDTPTSFNVISNDTQDADHTASNAITVGPDSITVIGPAGETFASTDATATIVSNQIRVSLTNSHFQQLAVGEHATITVPYTLTGDAGETSTANLVVTVNGVNDVPIAVDDTPAAITEDQVGTFTVLANDTLDADHGAPNSVTTGTVTNLVAPSGENIDLTDIGVSVNGSNQVVVTLGSDFQHMQGGETATFDIPYTVHGDHAGDTSTATLHVTVTGVNDAPAASPVTLDPGVESTAYMIKAATLLSGATDVDSPSLSITGLSVSAGGGSLHDNDDQTWTYTPAAHYNGMVSFNYMVSDGLLSATSTANLALAAVASQPVITADRIEVDVSSQSIPLNIQVSDTDTSDTLPTIQISGIPNTQYGLNHGSVNDDGVWTVNTTDLPDLKLVPVGGGTGAAGTITLHITATSVDHASTASATQILNIQVNNPDLKYGVDGYVADALVFVDANSNGSFDSGELFTYTASDGSFSLDTSGGHVILQGVQDADHHSRDTLTGLAFTGTLKAPTGSTVVTPLTTLIVAVAGPGGDTDAAETTVKTALGLSGSVDLTTLDPVAGTLSNAPGAAAVLAASIQVQATVTQLSAAISASADDVVSALAQTVTGGSVHLSDPATISTLATTLATTLNTGLDASDLSAISAVVSASNTQIASGVSGSTDLNDVAQASQVAFGSTTQALSQAATDGSFDQVQADYTGAALTAKIAAAPITITGSEAADMLTGAAGDDTLLGLGGNDRLMGGPGSDHLDGGAGFDRAIYTDATSGIVANLAAGTVTTGTDTDTITGIEGIVGSGFADTYNAAGFAGVSGVPGTPIGYNEFEGGAGNDTVIGDVNALGAYLTRVSYVSATAGVIVDLQAGTADGDASVGHDTFVGPGVQSVWGSTHDDTILGSNNGFGTVEVFSGFAGNDTINGRGGFDRADYNQDPTTTSGIIVHLAAGTVTGDASVGTDTLISVEAVRGTNFADTYDATGFSGTSTNAGSLGTFNEFTGGGGNDTIIGNGNTRISFNNATAGVTVDLQTGTTPGTGTATGDASVGTDTFSGVNAVQGSMFDDTIYGSNSTTAETFTGNGGNDYIDGRGGFDIASYNNIYLSTGSITVNMAAGIVVGDSSIGTDTLRSIEGIQGTGNADIYDATGYGAAGALNVGNNGTFNQFEGLGGNDTITGNGNTRVIYANAAAAVTGDLSLGTAHGTAAGDAAAIGTDTITGGVNSITGSAFGDSLTGNANSNTFVGGSGNDVIDGGAGGDIAIFTGARAQYTITANSPGAGQTTVADTVAGRDGTDTLTNVEVLQFTNTNVLIASGTSANPVDLSDNRLFFNAAANPLTSLTGSTDDFIKISQTLSGHLIDLGAGTNDTVALGVTGGYNLNLANVEHLVGTSGDDFVGFLSDVNGLSIDMGGGNDNVNLANGSNSVSVTNVENLNGSDFAAGSVSNDTLTLLNDVTGLQVNLANGTNTLNLAAGANSFIGIFSIDTINGTGSDDALSIANGLFTPNNDLSIDLGAGNDTLTVNSQFGSFALHNVEHLVVSGQHDAFYSLTNDQNGLSVDLGAGNTGLSIAAGTNTLSLTNVQSIGTNDYVGNAPASDDTLTLLDDITGVTVNLQQGDNTLNLAAGTNSLTTFNVQHINGTSSDDSLALQNQIFSSIDLGAGNDTLTLADGFNNVTVNNVEHVFGGAGSDNIVIANATGTTTVTGGMGSDFITASAATDVIRYTDASESSISTGEDTVVNFDAAHDSFLLDRVAGLAGSIHFMASGVLDGSPATPHAEAILTNGGGQTMLQIDVNGDGAIGAGDITVVLNSLSGTLSDANFSVITPNHAPTDILISNASVAENSPANTVVGTLSDMDPDAGDTAAFALTNDAGGLFAISNGNLVTTAPLDYEQAASHTVTVQVTDSAGAIFSKDIQIGVANVNEAPTDITLSNASVPENAPGGTAVGNLAAVDPDVGDTATYTLVDSAGGLFSLAASLLVTTAPLDYEQAASHQVTVRATDSGGLAHDTTFTIATANVNEAPTAVLLSNSSVAENSAANTVVGTLSAVDPDAGDSATFTLTNDAGGLFAISNGNLVATAPLDFEQAASHQVTVRATDSGGLTHDTTFAIATTNVNEAPTDIGLSSAAVPQGAAAGTVVGVLSAADPDAGDTAAFTLLDNDGGQFAISGGNLVVAGALAAGAQQVTVRDTDAGGLTFDKVLTVSVNSGALVVGTTGPDTLTGTPSDDTIQGLAGNDKLQGLAGNDTIDGGQGFDRAIYTDATSAITVNMAAGTVTGGSGSDTLINVESIVGSDFADTINTAGFTGDSGIAGNPLGLNEIEGRGGNDTIISDVNSQGAPLTRVSYVSAAAGVTVDLAAGTAHGTAAGDAANVGTDTLVGSGFSTVIGSAFADSLSGTSNANGTVEIFDGRGGNDTLNGGGGFDRADYALDPATASGITVSLAAGTVTGDGTIGTDTLLSIESVRGTNFADSFNATGFTGISANAGSNGTFNEFNGMGGNDTITGNGNTRLAFVNATGGVTVDMQTGATPGTGTDSGDASTGTDTFSGVNAIQASMFDDTIYGSNSTATTETFAGLAGNDYIDGRGGFDLATYNNIYFSTGPVTVNMGAGTATGDASIGNDTLRSIEAIQGTNFNDTYDASTFGTAGALNIGNNGTFNQFEGLGGNDTITGNGNTRVIYSSAAAGVAIHLAAGTATGDASVGTDTFSGVNSATGSQFADTYDATGFVGGGNFNLFEGLGGNDTITGNGNTRIAYSQAAAAVTVDLSLGTAHGTAGGDVAGVGTDTITGGVNSVQGSNFADTLIGGSGNETFFGGSGNDTISGGGGSDTISGQGGNDTIDGGAGTDMAVFTGAQAGYAIHLNTPGAGQVQVVDSLGAARDGTDVLTNIEVLQFSDATVLVTPGTAASPVDISALNLSNLPIAGTAGDDFLMVGTNVFGHHIDLGGGDDTVSLASANFYSLNLANVEHVTGSTGNDFVTLVNDASGLTVDLGAGTDNLTLAGGVNSLSAFNVENLNTNDFSGPAVDDTVTLQNDVTGMTVNLAQGNNTLNLAAGSNSFVDLFNVQHITGTASDDVLTVTDGVFTPDGNPVIDLGAGDNTLNFGAQGLSLTALNIQHINGNALDNFLTLNNDVSGVAIDLGAGNDHLTLADGVNSVSVANVESISSSDYTGGTAPSDDTLTLLNDVSGLSVDLADGNNTLNLAAGTNSLDNLFNIAHLNASASDDVLTVTQQSYGTIFDMGAGNDAINFGAQANGVTVVNAEAVNGSTGNDFITIGNSSAPATVTGGLGADNVTVGSTPVNFNFNSATESQTGNGDTVVNFDASKDTFTFTNMTGPNGFTGPVHFVDTAAFDGSAAAPHSEARVDTAGANATLQIDVNGDGVMDSHDIEIHLTNYTGTLHDSNFLLT